MYKFQPQLTKLYSSSEEYKKYYTTTNVYYTSGYGMPNCTCYALGRVLSTADLNNVDPKVNGFYGNGGLWGKDGFIGDKWTKSQVPKLGAVAVFEETGQAGHVAIVEEINEDGTVTTSNSGWSDYNRTDSNPLWWWLERNLDVNHYLNYKFLYYLYPPYIDEEPTPPEPPTPPKPPEPPTPTTTKSWIPLALCNAMPNNL